METIFYGASVFDSVSHSFHVRHVVVRDDRILDVTDDVSSIAGARKVDCSGLFMLPGLVDVHTHGRSGYDFTTVSENGLDELMLSYARTGTTSVMATLASAPYESWTTSFRMLRDYSLRSHPGSYLPGIHLEGRYLSEKRRGAHAAELLSLPSLSELSELLDNSSGVHTHISIAPELSGSDRFIAEALRRGASVGIAHTDCTYEEALSAVQAGAVSFTHTFNAMSPLHHRMPGCVAAALLSDNAYAELICDGLHSHPATSELLARTKPADRIVLITDSMEATGCADGNYFIAGLPVIVKNGRAVTKEGAIAGSTLNLFDGLVNFMHFTGLSLENALPAASENPARMIGASDQIGSIAPGKRADLLFIENKNSPRLHTVICGGTEL